MLFEDIEGRPAPRPTTDADGNKLVADGVTLFDIDQATVHFKMMRDELERWYVGVVEGWLPKRGGAATKRKGASLAKLKETDASHMLWRMKFPHLTEEEFRYCMDDCERRGLSMRSGHVWIKKEWRPGENRFELNIITTIGGMRAIGARTKKVAGRDRPIIEYGDNDVPLNAVVTIYRMVEGVRCPFVGDAAWKEYAPKGKDQEFWKANPEMSLARCAEAQAWRCAFPEELGGIYEQNEFAKERRSDGPSPDGGGTPAPLPPIDDDEAMSRFIFERHLAEMGERSPERRRAIIDHFRKKWPAEFERDEAHALRLALREVKQRPAAFNLTGSGD